MSEIGFENTTKAFAAADHLGVAVDADLGRNFDWWPILAVDDQAVEGPGYSYRFWQIDYVLDNFDFSLEEGVVQARRMVAAIAPGDRAEQAYWSKQAPVKRLEVHKGLGQLVMAHTGTTHSWLQTLSKRHSVARVLPGTFYTLRGDDTSEEPLVVSGFYEPALADFSEFETAIAPGQRELMDGTETIKVPTSWQRITGQAY